jgi:SM-20-related protein
MNADWAVYPDFLPIDVIDVLARDVRARWAADGLHTATVGRGASKQIREDVRGDKIEWLEESEASPAQAKYWQAMTALRLALNEELYLGLVGLQAHYAVFPPGSFYKRHLDRFQWSSDRALSCCLYLNSGWDDAWGGQLRMYVEDGVIDVSPRAGTLAVFRSDTVEHEVLPATQARFSLTGWFTRRQMS